MQKIEVFGNVNFCLDNQEPLYRSFSVEGDWETHFPETEVKWKVNNQYSDSLKRAEFFKLCKEVQGCEYSNVISILQKYGVTSQKRANSVQELDLIKALTNTFLWIESFLVEEYDLENSEFLPRIFDDFIIDLNNRATSQKDIYFLRKNYSESNYELQLKNLQEINLLSAFHLTTNKSDYKNYFIPFTKPGYKINVFKDELTFQLWKTIINDRHICLNSHFNKR